MDLLKKIFNSGIFFINIIFLILLILSSFSDRVSPNISIIFPYLGLIFPFLLLINVLFSIWWMITLKWKHFIICILCFIVCFNSIKIYFPIHARSQNIPTDCIKVLSYNIMQFEHKKKNKGNNPNEILTYLGKSNADIICLQEYGSHKNSKFLTENNIKQALSKYPYNKVYKLKWVYKNEIFGLAIFSRFPILSIKGIKFDSEYNGAFVAELDVNGKKVTLINNHLESNKLSMEERYEYRNLMEDFDSNKLDRVTEKMAKRLTPGFIIRAKQAEMVAAAIRESSNPYTIVCGDFNDTPISYTRRTVKGHLDDAFVETGSGLGVSYNKFRFYFRIDYILHSKNIKAYNCTVDNDIKNSDHYPIWTYLQLN